jgi:hypothetical protein
LSPAEYQKRLDLLAALRRAHRVVCDFADRYITRDDGSPPDYRGALAVLETAEQLVFDELHDGVR